jgi:glycosyltransferase involved in cell wall biosynthesis
MSMPVKSEVFLAVEIRHLIQQGATVEVFCLKKKPEQFEKLVNEQSLADIPIHHFPYFFSWQIWQDVWYWSKRKPAILLSLLWTLTRLCWKRPLIWLKSLLVVPKSFSLVRLMEADNITIIHVAWGHYPAITAYLAKKLLPRLHMTVSLGDYDRQLRHPITKLVSEQADYIFTQSEASAELIRYEWPRPTTPVIAIMRGIEVQTIDEFSAVETQPGLIVSAGRLEKHKGHQHVIRAFAHLHQWLPHTRLIILGEGSYRPQLEALVAGLDLGNVVDIPGHLPQKEVFQNMKRASIFALASEWRGENLPNVVKEAMALGLPVITSPTLGIEALVKDEQTGFIVEAGDIDSMVRRMQQILNNEQLQHQIRVKAEEQILAAFDISITTRQRLEIYHSFFQ